MAHRELWEIEIGNSGLNKHRIIRGSSKEVVERKARFQLQAWAEQWAKKVAAEEKKRNKEAAIKNKEEKKKLALSRTNDAEEAILQLQAILAQTLAVDDAINWSDLLDNNPFTSEEPTQPTAPEMPRRPERSDDKYQRDFLGKLFFGPVNEEKYVADHAAWMHTKQIEEEEHEAKFSEYSDKMRQWQEAKSAFEQKQAEKNGKILDKKAQYLKLEPGAIADYCEMVLSNSEYPDYFPQHWDIDYQTETKRLVVDYSLPDIHSLPTVKQVKYVISRDDFAETHLTAAALNKLYDGVLYQIALRTMHELFEADVVNALAYVVFNGWVDAVDKATGHNVNSCIMSVQAAKDEFSAINLARVDPKACFKQLNGVGGGKLHGLSPVTPVATIDKEGLSMNRIKV